MASQFYLATAAICKKTTAESRTLPKNNQHATPALGAVA
jgi:hypothetical protein